MKLKEKVKLLCDNDVVEIVSGRVFHVNSLDLDFVIHESIDEEREGLCDITEKLTGLRLLDNLKIKVDDITLARAIKEVEKCVDQNSRRSLVARLDKVMNIEDRKIEA